MKALVTATSRFQPVNARGKALAVRAMGVDAFEEEPLGDSPLKGLDRVIFPPYRCVDRYGPCEYGHDIRAERHCGAPGQAL